MKLVLLLAVLAQSGTAMRGRVSDAGTGLGGVEIVLRNEATGVTVSATSDAGGRWLRVGLDPGRWTVHARKIGYAAVRTTPFTLTIGRTVDVDLDLARQTVRLDSLVVRAEERTAPDRSELVDEELIRRTPVSGRSFTDLVALIPWVQLGGAATQGGTITLPGGRRSGTLLQMDGVGASSTFFGGEPRGSDRLPFPYSIEVVKELRVSANPYDVETGGFAGGVVNAVTRSGTNRWEVASYAWLRNASLTARDFGGDSTPDFSSRQFGAWTAGPLIPDRLHLFLSVERQARNQPVLGLPDPASVPDPARGIHPDSVARLITILRDVHGVNERAGALRQDENEWALFGRLDWQVTPRHRAMLRYNRTLLHVSQDRIGGNELSGNGGDFDVQAGSALLRVTSVLGTRWSHELTLHRGTESRPSSAYSLLPQAQVTITSDFDGDLRPLPDRARCCNDALYPTRLSESVWELGSTLHRRAGVHQLKLGLALARYGYTDDLFSGRHGTFVFSSLADLEQNHAAQFDRTLPNPGPDGEYFTADDREPRADFSRREVALFLQDVAEIGARLRVTLGVRAGLTRLGPAPALNQALQSGFRLRNDRIPSLESLDPRGGLVWDARGDGTRLIRIGAGRFTGQFPAALFSRIHLSDGVSSFALRCTGTEVPVPEYHRYAADPSSIPTACAGGGPGNPPVPSVSLFDPAFRAPRSLKASVSLEQRLGHAAVAGVSLLYARTTGNYFAEDRNLRPVQFRSAVENRPVFAPLLGIRPSGANPGQVLLGANRISPAFADVSVFESPAQARTLQVVLSLAGRVGGGLEGEASYAFTRSRDNGSYSCCAPGVAFNETPNDGDPNEIGRPGRARGGLWGPADFERAHVIVLSARGRLPGGIFAGGLFRLNSGRPWTPEVNGDPNGDGRLNNDRAYVGTDLLFEDGAADRARLEEHLAGWECLRTQAGTIVTRNSCRDGWSSTLDLRLSRAFTLGQTLRIEAVIDGFNILNGLDGDWGRQVGVTGDSQNLLIVRGFERSTGRYVYKVNEGFGLPKDLTASRFDQFSLQVGFRVGFRPE